mgnify:FL=1
MPPIQPSEVGPAEGIEETKDEDTPLSALNNINHHSSQHPQKLINQVF